MIKVTVNAGAYTLEITGTDLGDSQAQTAEFLSRFREYPGFRLEKYSENPGNSKASDSKTEVASRDDLLKWLADQDVRHAKAWIVKNSPYRNAGRLLARLEASGDLVTALTSYHKPTGHVGYMRAYYLPGDTMPEPWDLDPFEDEKYLACWLVDNQGHMPKFVEANCGIPPKQAAKALTAILLSKQAEVRKDPKDGKGRVYLTQVPENNGDQ